MSLLVWAVEQADELVLWYDEPLAIVSHEHEFSTLRYV